MTDENVTPTTTAAHEQLDVTQKVREEQERNARKGLDSKLNEEERVAFYDHSSERAMAIVLGAIVENHLTGLLRMLMRREENIARELFQSSGPLGPFGTKIRLAYMLRIIGPEMYGDLTIISKVRNKFAHDLTVVSFENQQISAWMQNMHIYGIVKKMAHDAKVRLDTNTSSNSTSDFIASGFTSSARDSYSACLRFIIHQIVDQETAISTVEENLNKK
jgi:DNA-binding MltR family transcriptional regulator